MKAWEYQVFHFIFKQLKKIKHMKKFIIKEFKPVYAIWTYEVEAADEEEAYEKVFSGEAQPSDYETQDNYSADSEFDIEEKQ